ncbi:MAG: hypothetical protein ACRDIZ_05195 [Actinomycetota bacterium]
MVLVGLAAALIASPALSLTPQDKKQVKKIAKKQATKVFNNLFPETEVGSGNFFLSSVTTLNFPITPAEECSTLTVPAAGISASDHVLVTPPPGWAPTFMLTAIPDPPNNQVTLSACNNFQFGAGDPDAGGGSYKLLVIR